MKIYWEGYFDSLSSAIFFVIWDFILFFVCCGLVYYTLLYSFFSHRITYPVIDHVIVTDVEKGQSTVQNSPAGNRSEMTATRWFDGPMQGSEQKTSDFPDLAQSKSIATHKIVYKTVDAPDKIVKTLLCVVVAVTFVYVVFQILRNVPLIFFNITWISVCVQHEIFVSLPIIERVGLYLLYVYRIYFSWWFYLFSLHAFGCNSITDAGAVFTVIDFFTSITLGIIFVWKLRKFANLSMKHLLDHTSLLALHANRSVIDRPSTPPSQSHAQLNYNLHKQQEVFVLQHTTYKLACLYMWTLVSVVVIYGLTFATKELSTLIATGVVFSLIVLILSFNWMDHIFQLICTCGYSHTDVHARACMEKCFKTILFGKNFVVLVDSFDSPHEVLV
ncbi:hypothetical protein RFI_09960 [Reticulomyxa filosa]|uniref:Uncharacterized protein n=1 Tax=Reticulomyxa filosa TaxID=46433 RepID=X6NP73_RETFI|nr:hypothetical protein RFI_09960 [Reticulomyxa filosa]|eukprot:ETO27172.1 hypothetical protein RFI_09960 [Reticulomyxa filosa]